MQDSQKEHPIATPSPGHGLEEVPPMRKERMLDAVVDQKSAIAAIRAAALDNTANSVMIANSQGVIIWANPAFTKLTGYALEEITGQTPSLLKSGKHDKAFYEDLWNTI